MGKERVEKILSIARDKIADDLGLIDEKQFSFCWITDYPMFEFDDKSNKIILAIILFNASR